MPDQETEEASSSCPECMCNHCIAVRMDEAFDTNYTGAKDRILVGDQFALYELSFWPRIREGMAVSLHALEAFTDFPGMVGKSAGRPIFYIPAIERWIKSHPTEVLFALGYERRRNEAEANSPVDAAAKRLEDLTLGKQWPPPFAPFTKLKPQMPAACPNCGVVHNGIHTCAYYKPSKTINVSDEVKLISVSEPEIDDS